jgi:hypothetical protein
MDVGQDQAGNALGIPARHSIGWMQETYEVYVKPTCVPYYLALLLKDF